MPSSSLLRSRRSSSSFSAREPRMCQQRVSSIQNSWSIHYCFEGTFRWRVLGQKILLLSTSESRTLDTYPLRVLCGKIGFDIEARDVIGMYGGNIVAETKIIDIGKTLRELLDPLLCRIWKAIIVYDDQGSVWRRESSPYQNIDQRMERIQT